MNYRRIGKEGYCGAKLTQKELPPEEDNP
jgi:hypothetical protein